VCVCRAAPAEASTEGRGGFFFPFFFNDTFLWRFDTRTEMENFYYFQFYFYYFFTKKKKTYPLTPMMYIEDSLHTSREDLLVCWSATAGCSRR
jgi:hypothetical protein